MSQELGADEEADVTGILCLEDSKRILTVGWNRRIITYDDSRPEENKLKPNSVWKGGQVRVDVLGPVLIRWSGKWMAYPSVSKARSFKWQILDHLAWTSASLTHFPLSISNVVILFFHLPNSPLFCTFLFSIFNLPIPNPYVHFLFFLFSISHYLVSIYHFPSVISYFPSVIPHFPLPCCHFPVIIFHL